MAFASPNRKARLARRIRANACAIATDNTYAGASGPEGYSQHLVYYRRERNPFVYQDDETLSFFKVTDDDHNQWVPLTQRAPRNTTIFFDDEYLSFFKIDDNDNLWTPLVQRQPRNTTVYLDDDALSFFTAGDDNENTWAPLVQTALRNTIVTVDDECMVVDSTPPSLDEENWDDPTPSRVTSRVVEMWVTSEWSTPPALPDDESPLTPGPQSAPRNATSWLDDETLAFAPPSFDDELQFVLVTQTNPRNTWVALDDETLADAVNFFLEDADYPYTWLPQAIRRQTSKSYHAEDSETLRFASAPATTTVWRPTYRPRRR